MDRKFLENKGFGERLIEINDGEMPSEIFENRKFGLGVLYRLQRLARLVSSLIPI
jgi:hypothetical protein